MSEGQVHVRGEADRRGIAGPRPRRRRTIPLAIVVLATMAVVVGPRPAGAATAPLTTDSAIGVRVDETALDPVVDDLEQTLQPVVDAAILDGAAGPGGPFATYIDVDVSSDLDLDIDVIAPGTAPEGSVTLAARLDDLVIDYLMPGPGSLPDCYVSIEPGVGTADATADVNSGNLPGSPPFDPAGVTATWDLLPGFSTTGGCWMYLAAWSPPWWVGQWGTTGTVATNVEAEIAMALDELLADVWNLLVEPVNNSIAAFGFDVTVTTVHTDAAGLITVSATNASSGVDLGSGPHSVSSAQDSGSTSNVFTALATQDPLVVSIHPNVINQLLDALHQALAGAMGSNGVDGPSTEAYLLPPLLRGSFSDGDWTLAGVNVDAPYLDSTSGVPLLTMASSSFRFRHPGYLFGIVPIATFAGSVTGVDLITEDRGTVWGPAFRSGTGTAPTLSLTGGSMDVATWGPDPADMAPYVGDVVHDYSDIIPTLVDMAPHAFRSTSVDPCPNCGTPGDDRYTVSFALS